jgi:hypothetical protein
LVRWVGLGKSLWFGFSGWIDVLGLGDEVDLLDEFMEIDS